MATSPTTKEVGEYSCVPVKRFRVALKRVVHFCLRAHLGAHIGCVIYLYITSEM